MAIMFITEIQSLFDTLKNLIKIIKQTTVIKIFLPHSKCFQGWDCLQLAGQI